MSTIAKPATTAQLNRIRALTERGIIHVPVMPETSWEASCIIRNAPASKYDKEQLKNRGGRVIARMTSSELEMTSKVLDALRILETSKDTDVMDAVSILRKQFTPNKQQ